LPFIHYRGFVVAGFTERTGPGLPIRHIDRHIQGLSFQDRRDMVELLFALHRRVTSCGRYRSCSSCTYTALSQHPHPAHLAYVRPLVHMARSYLNDPHCTSVLDCMYFEPDDMILGRTKVPLWGMEDSKDLHGSHGHLSRQTMCLQHHSGVHQSSVAITKSSITAEIYRYPGHTNDTTTSIKVKGTLVHSLSTTP